MVKIYSDSEDIKPTVYLDLREDGTDIDLVMVNPADGSTKRVAWITEEGEMKLVRGLTSDCGLAIHHGALRIQDVVSAQTEINNLRQKNRELSDMLAKVEAKNRELTVESLGATQPVNAVEAVIKTSPMSSKRVAFSLKKSGDSVGLFVDTPGGEPRRVFHLDPTGKIILTHRTHAACPLPTDKNGAVLVDDLENARSALESTMAQLRKLEQEHTLVTRRMEAAETSLRMTFQTRTF